MFKKGDIVYHDDFKFLDGTKDQKIKRPCLVLFSVVLEDGEYVCTCPFTSQVNTFNKRPYNYQFVPYVIYNYKKLNFIKLNCASIYKGESTHSTGMKLDSKTVNSVVQKLIVNKDSYPNIELYDFIVKYFEYSKLFDILEEKEIKKQLTMVKKQKRCRI